MTQAVYNWLTINLTKADCRLCSSPLAPLGLCPGCAADLPVNRHPCHRCAAPLEFGGGLLVCGACLRRPPPFDAARAPWLYTAPIDHLVKRMKLRGHLADARLLGLWMAEALRDEERPDVIAPVPLHPARIRSRGFNQAMELARPVARRLGVELNGNLLSRTRATPTQTGLAAKKRRGNVHGAFAARDPIKGLHVALFDDVMTTGSTVAEAARVLRRAGAVRVTVWVAARAG